MRRSPRPVCSLRCCSVIDAVYSDTWPGIDFAAATDLPILTTLLSSPAFWSTLHPATAPFSAASFGQGQPHVRQAAWVLVGSLVGVFKGLFLCPRRVFMKSLRFASYTFF